MNARAVTLPRARTPNGLPSVAKSPICVASLRRSSVAYSRYAPSSLLALLASPRFRSVRQPDRRSRRGLWLGLLALVALLLLAELLLLAAVLPVRYPTG